ncbi:MAG: acetate kinase [Firmicutes bacterium]|nr:acetate kinase [Bacillota bacterium]
MIFIINLGSSSFKFKIFDKKVEKCLCLGLCERIGTEAGSVIYRTDLISKKFNINLKNHKNAFIAVKKIITDPEIGVIKDLSEIRTIGHRVVHGGNYFRDLTLISTDVIKKIRELIPIAPIHNCINLEGILNCENEFPNITQFAVFDTSFFTDLPDTAVNYGLPFDLAKKYEIKKYGFHGISHEWSNMQYKFYFKKKLCKIITCHLGNGSSICAINNDKPLDTSMGFTPLDGLIMGTRSGSIDPSILTHLMKKENLDISKIEEILNKKSGLLGISGFSNDIRDLIKKNDTRSKLAVNMFCYRILKYIGAYYFVLSGVDAIVFTAGIGENQSYIRKKICKNLEFIGVKINDDLNRNTIDGKEGLISDSGSKVDIFVSKVDEELAIARKIRKFISESC